MRSECFYLLVVIQICVFFMYVFFFSFFQHYKILCISFFWYVWCRRCEIQYQLVWCRRCDRVYCILCVYTVIHLNMVRTLYSAITVLRWIALSYYSGGRTTLFIFAYIKLQLAGLTNDQGSSTWPPGPARLWRQWLMAACSIHVPPMIRRLFCPSICILGNLVKTGF